MELETGCARNFFGHCARFRNQTRNIDWATSPRRAEEHRQNAAHWRTPDGTSQWAVKHHESRRTTTILRTSHAATRILSRPRPPG